MKGHTLVLAGELDRVSAPVLETEIERLCGIGVVELTLDLRELSEIDSVGVAVIAHRSGWCARRGCEMTLLADPGPMRHAFALTEASERVTFAPAEQPAFESQVEQQEPTARPQFVRPNAFAPPGRVALAASTAHVGDEDARSASLLRVTGRRARARARRSRRGRGRR